MFSKNQGHYELLLSQTLVVFKVKDSSCTLSFAFVNKQVSPYILYVNVSR